MGNNWFHEYFINELKAIGRKPTSNMQHEVVDSLPSSGNEQTIYFVKNDSSSSNNYYDEYVWISSSSAFEKIGSTQSDGSTTQPDWNQNDATQPDYVKNRPFYTGDPVETVFVEERVVTFENRGEGLYMGSFETTFVATVSETYKVYWDGTAYECACGVFEDSLFIGNLSIAINGTDTGEPFLISVENGIGITIGTADTSASHTISISGRTTQIVKIDPKYLDQSDWDQNDVTASSYIKNRPFYTGYTEEKTLVNESSVDFRENSGNYSGLLRLTFTPIAGETYKVLWDGTIYESVCLNGQGDIAIGNLSIVGVGSNTGEPFLITVGNYISIYTLDTASSHVISIRGRTIQVVKIDEKYLPNTVATKSDVETAQTAATNAQSTANNAVKYTASQNLTDAQKQQARTNIGAGTSSFSGNYNDLVNKPTIVQGDWDVNNDADMAYIKNRTHYTEINTEAIVEKHNINYKPVEGGENVSSLNYTLSSFSNLGISDTFNIAQGDILKIDRYRGPTNSQYTYIDTISGELTKITGKNGYDYVCYVFGNAYLFKNVTVPAPPIDISSDYDNGITYAGFIGFAYSNGKLYSDQSVICLMVPLSMINSNAFDISILSSTIHMLDEKYIPSTIAKTSDIPTDVHINELINTALSAIGVAEEGTY